MRQEKKKLLLVIISLIIAGISPNLFPVSQAGIAKLSSLAVEFLIPSVVITLILIMAAHALKYDDVRKQITNGIIAGLVGTIGLEIVREIGFRIGGMPGDMPKLLGVLLLDRFAQGPSFWSNVAGWAYHFWNGAAFGIIFSLFFGRGKTWMGIIYGIIIGIGFMVSPATRALGIGAFGLQFKDGWQFLTTVTLAHIALGSVLGWIIYKKNAGIPNIFVRLKKGLSNANKVDTT
ncbi:hypothetical protein [Prolixibacter sp. SD074]|jgi:hypothetical protein|uniref:hypothetical protein n=1 Tax=Prolixibacter sp. SD074 TaxID=2652391 RepID=UPI00126ECBCF|nr:hypothetical protein [Prolixibacter sp. SD074]GET28792.1 hypothetical protein SD074_09940 [Prolixibacter sp. SD074]